MPSSDYLSLDKGGEVVVDLGRVAVIDCLEYMPRNDDNFISPGDIYELFCHAGTEGWKSLGKQRADTTCLDWIVPDNALFWLRDLTRGRKENMFFIYAARKGNFSCGIFLVTSYEFHLEFFIFSVCGSHQRTAKQ